MSFHDLAVLLEDTRDKFLGRVESKTKIREQITKSIAETIKRVNNPKTRKAMDKLAKSLNNSELFKNAKKLKGKNQGFREFQEKHKFLGGIFEFLVRISKKIPLLGRIAPDLNEW